MLLISLIFQGVVNVSTMSCDYATSALQIHNFTLVRYDHDAAIVQICDSTPMEYKYRSSSLKNIVLASKRYDYYGVVWLLNNLSTSVFLL